MTSYLNLNSPIVDCDWAAWDTWTNCTKIDSEDCAVQGGGKRERTRSQSIAEQNSGVDCEADSMDENWLCCADKDTDSDNCPTEECLEGNDEGFNMFKVHLLHWASG